MTHIRTLYPLIFFILLFTWMSVIVFFLKNHPQLLVIICFIIPMVSYAIFSCKNHKKRLKELITICSYFMLLVILFYWLFIEGYETLVSYSNYFFISYFVLQAIGFVIDFFKKRQRDKKMILGISVTLLGMINILFWILLATNKSYFIDNNVGILIFGVPEPEYIIIVYCLWFIYVIMNSSTLPNLSELIAHTLSLIVAIISGQFFLSRLLLASHLFIMDYFTGYSQSGFFIKNMPRLTGEFYPEKWIKLQSYFAMIIILILIFIFGYQLYLF